MWIPATASLGVAYDASTNSVRIDNTSPYVGEVKPTPAPVDGVIVVPQSDAELLQGRRQGALR